MLRELLDMYKYGELSELFGLANEISIPCLQVSGGILECFASPT